MSNIYQPKRKELAKVQVVSSETYSKCRSRFKFVGSVHRGYTNFVTTTRNRKTGKCSFIDDTSSLTKKTKGEIVRFFSNNDNRGKGVVYLVVPKDNKKFKKGAAKLPKEKK